MYLKDFYSELILTDDQARAVEKLQVFLDGDEQVFVLQGYAGSGKTTLLTGLVKYLDNIHRPLQLMAPTGRAAKVINDKTGEEATTIHKGIYSFDDLIEIDESEEKDEEKKKKNSTFLYQFKLRQDQNIRNKVLIVDEASMVSNNLSQGEFFRFGSGYLMNDLLAFARLADPQLKTKIIFVGDPAQLPPVGVNFSPALSELYLTEKFNIQPVMTELKEVKRQSSDNGILKSASQIRKGLTSGYFNDFDISANGVDRFVLDYSMFFQRYFELKAPKQIITYMNKTSSEINKRIRELKYGSDMDIQVGDIVISGTNNYKANILNGEFAVVTEVLENVVHRNVPFRRKGGEVVHVDLHWRAVKLIKDDRQLVEGYILENYLNGDNDLLVDEMRALYVDFKNRHPKLKAGSAEFKEAIKNDLFFNSLMIKYGYSVTCHKAQGGEWERTLVVWDRGIGENNFQVGEKTRRNKSNKDFYRWAYTAITRASKEMFSLNPPQFNSYSSMNYIDPAVQESFEQLTGSPVVAKEVQLDNELQSLLRENNLIDQPLQLQDHFISLWFNLRKKYIDIVSWERKNYEVWYQFKREDQLCGLKFWINGKLEFKSNYAHLPALTNSEELLSIVNEMIKTLNPVKVIRNTVEIITERLEFENEIEEEYPFLKILFDDLNSICKPHGIGIEHIEHQKYKDRYTFSKGEEKGVVDFEYNKAGFFGRAVPLTGKSNSSSLLDEVKIIIKELKKDVI
jgi:hypothetical protein